MSITAESTLKSEKLIRTLISSSFRECTRDNSAAINDKTREPSILMVNYEVTRLIRPFITSAVTTEIRWKMSHGRRAPSWFVSLIQEGRRVVLPAEDLFRVSRGVDRGGWLVGSPGRGRPKRRAAPGGDG